MIIGQRTFTEYFIIPFFIPRRVEKAMCRIKMLLSENSYLFAHTTIYGNKSA